MPREAFAKPWTTRKVLLLGLGDSVTAGFGVAPPYSYFNRLVKNPRRRVRGHAGHLPVGRAAESRRKNLAVSGSTSLMHLETIRDRWRRRTPTRSGWS